MIMNGYEDDMSTCDIPSDQDVSVVDRGAGDVRDAGHVLSVPVMQKYKIIITYSKSKRHKINATRINFSPKATQSLRHFMFKVRFASF